MNVLFKGFIGCFLNILGIETNAIKICEKGANSKWCNNDIAKSKHLHINR